MNPGLTVIQELWCCKLHIAPNSYIYGQSHIVKHVSHQIQHWNTMYPMRGCTFGGNSWKFTKLILYARVRSDVTSVPELRMLKWHIGPTVMLWCNTSPYFSSGCSQTPQPSCNHIYHITKAHTYTRLVVFCMYSSLLQTFKCWSLTFLCLGVVNT